MKRLRTYLPEDEAREIEAASWDEGIDDAIRAAALRGEVLSRRDVAAMLGVDESYLRAVCKGLKPISAHRLAQLRADARAAINTARERHLAPVGGLVASPLPAASKTGAAGAALASTVCRALADGVLTPEEVAEIRAAADVCTHEAAKVRPSQPDLTALRVVS